MPKTEQKNMRFTPETLKELAYIRAIEQRSDQNMVEVLIHRDYLEKLKTSGSQKVDPSGIAVVNG